MTDLPFGPSRSGQATLELLLSVPLIIVSLAGAGWVLSAEYRRIRCARLSFEEAHSTLHNRLHLPRWEVRIDENDRAVRSRAQCGKLREELALKRLEAIEW